VVLEVQLDLPRRIVLPIPRGDSKLVGSDFYELTPSFSCFLIIVRKKKSFSVDPGRRRPDHPDHLDDPDQLNHPDEKTNETNHPDDAMTKSNFQGGINRLATSFE
jgi:hypothetical protein